MLTLWPSVATYNGLASIEMVIGATDTIRVLTLNAHQGLTAGRRPAVLPRMRDALRETNTDLVFLQEIGLADGATQPTHQYEILADGVWPQHAYGRNAVSTGGHHGNALLSKYPIVAWENVDASVGRAEPRGFLHCTLDVPGLTRPLHAVCVHFALSESHRRWQAERLLQLVAAGIPVDSPVVIAGDFNDWRSSVHRLLTADRTLEEIHATARGSPARTFPARWPLLRLDRIYVRHLLHRPLHPRRRPWGSLSDHVPLAGEVWVSGETHGESLASGEQVLHQPGCKPA